MYLPSCGESVQVPVASTKEEEGNGRMAKKKLKTLQFLCLGNPGVPLERWHQDSRRSIICEPDTLMAK